jgi:uncharacterized membrane protein
MNDLTRRPADHLVTREERSDRNAALTVYWLYLVAPFTAGITGLIGALIASGRRARSAPLTATHFRHQVWTFGAATGAALTGGFWASVGGIATVADRTGGDLVLAGAALSTTAGIGFLASTIFGLTRASGGEPIGRPE